MTRLFSTIAWSLLLLTRSLPSSAQDAPFTFGAKAGINLSEAAESSDPDIVMADRHSTTGFQVALTAEYGLNRYFYLQSAMAFTTKGVRRSSAERWIGGPNVPVTRWERTTTLYYLQVPFKLAGKFPLAPATRLFLNAGAYAAYALTGKAKTESRTVGEDFDSRETRQEKPFDKDTYELAVKRFDYGLSFGIGVEVKKIVAGVEYDLGLGNIGQEYLFYSYRYRNRNVAFTVGYLF